MGILDGLLDALLGGGTSADDVNSILGATAANTSALSNIAAANSNTLVATVIDGMTNMVNTTLQTTFDGVIALEESTMAGSAEAMNSVAGSAVDFDETTYSMYYIGSYDSPSHQKVVVNTLTHDGGSAVMSAYATHTLGGLTAGVGEGIAGMMTGVGNGAGTAMANLGAHVPDMLPGLTTSLGGTISASLGTAGMLAGSSL
ncbi:MAG: hypothetical protein PHS77_05505 [Gallionellaceae bacterium]|nr:hypothetical protein [Gallionellaceae bacterium]